MSKQADTALTKAIVEERSRDPQFGDKISYWNYLHEMYEGDAEKIKASMIARFGGDE